MLKKTVRRKLQILSITVLFCKTHHCVYFFKITHYTLSKKWIHKCKTFWSHPRQTYTLSKKMMIWAYCYQSHFVKNLKIIPIWYLSLYHTSELRVPYKNCTYICEVCGEQHALLIMFASTRSLRGLTPRAIKPYLLRRKNLTSSPYLHLSIFPVCLYASVKIGLGPGFTIYIDESRFRRNNTVSFILNIISLLVFFRFFFQTRNN